MGCLFNPGCDKSDGQPEAEASSAGEQLAKEYGCRGSSGRWHRDLQGRGEILALCGSSPNGSFGLTLGLATDGPILEDLITDNLELVIRHLILQHHLGLKKEPQ